MQGASHALYGAAVRLSGWLNGLAALMLAAFALGVLGPDVDPPDLRLPLACFLAGGLGAGAAAALAFLAQLAPAPEGGAGRRWWARTAVLACLGAGVLAYAGFAAGCWLVVAGTMDGVDGDSTLTLYATGAPASAVRAAPDMPSL